jgi:predicted amidophosphoribosyltransferase
LKFDCSQQPRIFQAHWLLLIYSFGQEIYLSCFGGLVKKCIACAEEIQNAAKLCRHCNTLQADTRFSAAGQGSFENAPVAQSPHSQDEVKGGFLATFSNPQNWNIADSEPNPGESKSVFCTACGVRNSELDKHCGSCGEPLIGNAALNSINTAQPYGQQFASAGSTRFDKEFDRLILRLKTDHYLPAAWVFTLATVFDSLFWITWRDPFGTNATLLLGQFLEWSLPTAAAIILFLNAKKPAKNLLISALVVGGALPLFFDLILNATSASNLFSIMGIWSFGDLVDFAASVGLIVFASLSLKKL